jgi:nitroimidazol reductase NimA-like FMN-containing flavoprotein (pyridoxamine 5'-phosphate oxidase superfamily)
MPGPMTEGERQGFLAGRHVGVVSVARGDGRPPHSTPVWYAYDPGGNISFFTGTQGRRSRKAELVREAGVLSFVVQREEFPYAYVTIEGTVVGEDSPPSAEQVLAVVRRYLPEEQAQPFVDSELRQPLPKFVLFTIRPDRWLSFDFSDEERE